MRASRDNIKWMTKAIKIAHLVLTILIGIILIGGVIDLLKRWVGVAAYFLWPFVSPIFSPAVFFLPWFNSWVDKEPVNERVLWIWIAWLALGIVRVLNRKDRD